MLKIIKSPNYILLIFLFILIIPGSISTAGIYLSHAPGMILGASLIFLSVIISNKKLDISKESLSIILIISSILLLNFSMSLLFYGPVNYFNTGGVLRFIFSFLLLLYLVYAAHFLVKYLNSLTENQFNKIIFIIYFFSILVAFISIPMHYYDVVSRKQMIFFSEPSHFAIGFAPFYFYQVVNSPNYFRHVAIVFLIGLLLQNVTLLVICIMGFLLHFKKYNFKFVFLLALFSSFFMFYLISFGDSVSFILERINILEDTSESSNLSLLILLSSYERAYLGFIESNGIGIGFQQMGYIGSMGTIQEIIKQGYGVYLNVNDGGNISSKLISEFGFLGLIIITIYLTSFIKILNKVRARQFLCKQHLFYYLVFLFFIILLFIRAASYFTPSSFLFLVALIGINSFAIKQSTGS